MRHPVAARRERRHWARPVAAGAAAVCVVLALAGLGVFATDVTRMQADNADRPPPTPAQRAAAAPAAQAAWRDVRRRLEVRLHQGLPLELGAVWLTREGVICGVVNGRQSFGGLTGMTAFHTQGEAIVFPDDEDGFSKRWFDCRRDHWVDLVAGSEATGPCASRTTHVCTYKRAS